MSHLAGKSNTHADTLSHNNASHFLSTFPRALQQSAPNPAALTDLLVDTKPDWTSLSWSRMFSSIFKQPSPKAQCTPTPQATASIPTSAPTPATNPSLLQRPSSASLSASLNSNSLSTKPSDLTCPASASFTLPTMEMTPSSGTCPGFSTSSAASIPRKRRRISNHDHIFQ